MDTVPLTMGNTDTVPPIIKPAAAVPDTVAVVSGVVVPVPGAVLVRWLLLPLEQAATTRVTVASRANRISVVFIIRRP